MQAGIDPDEKRGNLSIEEFAVLSDALISLFSLTPILGCFFV